MIIPPECCRQASIHSLKAGNGQNRPLQPPPTINCHIRINGETSNPQLSDHISAADCSAPLLISHALQSSSDLYHLVLSWCLQFLDRGVKLPNHNLITRRLLYWSKFGDQESHMLWPLGQTLPRILKAQPGLFWLIGERIAWIFFRGEASVKWFGLRPKS